MSKNENERIEGLDLENVIVLDIETVPLAWMFSNLPRSVVDAWLIIHLKKYKAEYDSEIESFRNKATLHPEFCKVICFSLAYFEKGTLNVEGYSGNIESILLKRFTAVMDRAMANRNLLSGMYIKGYDIPFIAKRMMIEGVAFPEFLDSSVITGVSVENEYILDVADFWNMNRGRTSLNTLCAALDIESPKKVPFAGWGVGQYYYASQEKLKTVLPDIVDYCSDDAAATMKALYKIHTGCNFVGKETRREP